MLLQVVYVDDLRIQLSDGMNTCYLNADRPRQTIDAMCRKINKAATAKDLFKSIFMVADFRFDFDWDYDNKRLMVALDTDTFEFLHPGCLHEKVFRSKDLTSVLGNLERETLKRTAMKKRLPASSFMDIEMGELIGTTSTGGLVVEEELLNQGENTKGLVPSSMAGKDLTNLGGRGMATEDSGTITKCLMKNGWLTFPHLESEKVPTTGGLFDSFEDFLQICKFSLVDCNEEKKVVEKEFSSSANNPMSKFMDSLPKGQSQAKPQRKAAPSSSKSRLKKDTAFIYRDTDVEESPIKGFPVKVERIKGISKEDEAALEHLINITKSNKTPMKQEDTEPEPKKAMRKVKLNKKQRYECESSERSPAKVSVHLRIPLTERQYGFRNRDGLKSKDIF